MLGLGVAYAGPFCAEADQILAPMTWIAELDERAPSAKEIEHGRRIAQARFAGVLSVAAPAVISGEGRSQVEGVEVDVAHCHEKVLVRFNGEAAETVLEDGSHVAVPAVEEQGV